MLRTLLLSLLIFLWAYTGIAKVSSMHHFSLQIMRMPWIGAYRSLLSGLTPIVELLICVLLIFPRTIRTGLQLSLFLLTGFTIYILLTLSFAEQVPCACGGVISSMSWQQHLLFNLSFIVINLFLLHKNLFSQALRKKTGYAENLQKE